MPRTSPRAQLRQILCVWCLDKLGFQDRNALAVLATLEIGHSNLLPQGIALQVPQMPRSLGILAHQ